MSEALLQLDVRADGRGMVATCPACRRVIATPEALAAGLGGGALLQLAIDHSRDCKER